MIQKFLSYRNPALGLLLLRVALGAVFIVHGWMKLQNMDGTIGFFASLGLASFFAYLVMLLELVGGILLILGAFTSLMGFLLAVDMLFAILLVKGSKGFAGGYEFELTLLLASLAIALIGSGAYSIQRGNSPTS